MRCIVRVLPVLAASLSLSACTSTYHPEYHPISVSQFSQNLSYPVSVQNGGDPMRRSPVIVAPVPAQTVVVPVDPAAAPYVAAPSGWPQGN